MLILSIQTGHNATVGLVENGEIVGLFSQEKVDNVKNSAAFPSEAIHALLKETGHCLDDIDEIAVASNVIFPPDAYEYLYDKRNRIRNKNSAIALAKTVRESKIGPYFNPVFKILSKLRLKHLARQGDKYLNKMFKELGLDNKKTTNIEHHTCHAYSAYYGLCDDFSEPALIFTADGSGDGLSATVSVAKNGVVERIASTPQFSSLGGIYSNTTRFLGMKILEHEYKVMGLAPYSKGYEADLYNRVFAPVIDLDDNNPLVFKSTVDASKFYDYLVEHAVGERFDNIAGAVQMLLETLVVKWIENAIEKTGITNIYTGGGLFMNVKLNKRIQELTKINKIKFLPSCGDESNPIGAGYALALKNNEKLKPLNNLYLGVSYSEREIESFINERNLFELYEVKKCDDIESEIAKLLAQKEIVARFSGRCEWGARSLGNRAILAHPSYMESFYTVNDLIKARDFWMPFAPSILDNYAGSYLEDYDPNKLDAPYMITAYRATKIGLEHLRAALHQGDHTLRPQVVTKSVNPKYYELISSFEKLSGVGAVLNTSFNLHGYPLVATPEQAIMTLENSGLKHLALENYLLSKRS